MTKPLLPYPVHIVIPDTQVSPENPYDHLGWISQYIFERYAEKEQSVTVVHLGDHWDMPSLSSYDKGKRAMEGRRIYDDLNAGNEAFALLDGHLQHENFFDLRKVVLMGNHEERLVRATETDAQLHGVLSLDDFNTLDWEWHKFLVPVCIDGVWYSHYFYNSMNGRPISGMIETRIKNIGHSFTQGHQQTLMYGVRPVLRGFHHGLVAGACYLHDEDYKGPQGNDHWRGIIVCNEVRDGNYDPMFVSLDYLCRRYEGVTLDEVLPTRSVMEHSEETIRLFNTGVAAAEAFKETKRQVEKWGVQHHDDYAFPNTVGSDHLYYRAMYYGIPTEDDAKDLCQNEEPCTWAAILIEELCEAIATTNQTDLCKELIQVAAVALSWVADIDERTGA